MENLKLMSKEDLLNLQVGDEIMIGHHYDPLQMSKNVFKVISVWPIIPEGKFKKIKVRFLYESISYKTNKPIVRKWNLVVGDSINRKGEQRVYTDSFKGRAGTNVFFKLEKNGK